MEISHRISLVILTVPRDVLRPADCCAVAGGPDWAIRPHYSRTSTK
jgi:hypothetical protein